MIYWERDHSVAVEKAKKLSPEEMEGKFTIGLLHKDENKPEYVESYDKAVGIIKEG